MIQAWTVGKKLPFGGKHELGEGPVQIIGVKAGTVTVSLGQNIVVAIGAGSNIDIQFETAIVIQYPAVLEGVGIQGGGHDENNQS